MGWRGSGRHWAEYKWAYLLLAGLSTPLVLSVHTIVSFDFAMSVIPGWHTTIFPPYFVAGAVFSGFAMVLTWMMPARQFLGLKHVVTLKHLENMTKVMLATGMMVTYGYVMEHFIAWYSGNPYESGHVLPGSLARPVGADLLADGLLQRASCRSSSGRSGCAPACPMHLGRLDPDQRRDVVRALQHRRHLAAPRLPPFEAGRTTRRPGSTSACSPATIGLFSTLFLLFLKFVPAVAVTEVKELRHELAHDADRRSGGGDALMSSGHGGFIPRRFVLAEFASGGRSAGGHHEDARGGLQGPRHAHPVPAARDRGRAGAQARPRSRPSFCAARSPGRSSPTR